MKLNLRGITDSGLVDLAGIFITILRDAFDEFRLRQADYIKYSIEAHVLHGRFKVESARCGRTCIAGQ